MKLSRLLTGELALVSLCGLVATGQTPLPAATTHHLRYRFVDLGTFGGPGSVFPEFQTVVNNFGSAVGGADLEASNPNPECFNPIYVPDCNIQHAFLVRAGHLADLGTIRGGANSFAFAINQFGSIAGVSETSNVDLVSGFSEFHAVLWRNGHPKDLGTLGGTSSLAVWVNDWGLAVGSAQNDVADQFSFMGLGTQTRGFISTGETMRDLGTLGGPDTFAQYVNNRGQVAGVSYTSDAADPATGVPQLDPFLWEDGRMKDLGNLGGTNAFLGPFIYGLNNRGEVAGVMALAGDRTGHAFLWNGKKLIDLETLGGSFSGATGLNDSGEVIGYAALPGDAVGHGFLWQNGVIHDLPPVDGDVCSLPLWINAKGQVAGNSSLDCNTDLHAVLWNDGIAIDLNQFLPPGSGRQLVNAVEITDDGIIAGAAAPPGVSVSEAESRGHAFLLIPCELESSPDCIDQAVNTVSARRPPAPLVQSSSSPASPVAVPSAQAYIKTRMRRYQIPGR